jgi:hypothetical protein
VYTATITVAVKDLAGNAMVSDYAWSFTTGTAADTTAPTVFAVSPAAGATGVWVGSAITATFSEAMDPATIDTSSFTVTRGTTGVVTYDAGTNTATFAPSKALVPGRKYNVSITTAATDVVGNPMQANYTWSFNTAP